MHGNDSVCPSAMAMRHLSRACINVATPAGFVLHAVTAAQPVHDAESMLIQGAPKSRGRVQHEQGMQKDMGLQLRSLQLQ